MSRKKRFSQWIRPRGRRYRWHIRYGQLGEVKLVTASVLCGIAIGVR